MEALTHRDVQTNGIALHRASAGKGPLVILLHGFPEVWYSWRVLAIWSLCWRRMREKYKLKAHTWMDHVHHHGDIHFTSSPLLFDLSGSGSQ